MPTHLPKSGTGGDVQIAASSVAEIKSWAFSRSSNNPAWASNVSAGYKKRVGGVKDATLTFEFVYDFNDPIENLLREGDSVTVVLFADATHSYSVPIIVSSLELNTDINDGEPFGGTISGETNGAWTDPT
jgi:hypothetical protein